MSKYCHSCRCCGILYLLNSNGDVRRDFNVIFSCIHGESLPTNMQRTSVARRRDCWTNFRPLARHNLDPLKCFMWPRLRNLATSVEVYYNVFGRYFSLKRVQCSCNNVMSRVMLPYGWCLYNPNNMKLAKARCRIMS